MKLSPMYLLLATISLPMLSAPATGRAENLKAQIRSKFGMEESNPYVMGLRCAAVRASLVKDLPGWCSAEEIDQIRMRDFGHQLRILEDSCGGYSLHFPVTRAIDLRINDDDRAGCAAIATLIENKYK